MFDYLHLEFDDTSIDEIYPEAHELNETLYLDNFKLRYDYNLDRWVNKTELTQPYRSGTFHCKTKFAAKRHLKKHDEILPGARFRLISKREGIPDLILVKE